MLESCDNGARSAQRNRHRFRRQAGRSHVADTVLRRGSLGAAEHASACATCQQKPRGGPHAIWKGAPPIGRASSGGVRHRGTKRRQCVQMSCAWASQAGHVARAIMVIASGDTDKHCRGHPAASGDSCVTAVYMRWRYRRYARAGDPGHRWPEDHSARRAGTPSLVQFPNHPDLRQ